MAAELLLPRDSAIFEALDAAASERRCVFLAGLPGVGKSLLLQQLTILAAERGRLVHLLQWDVARGAFETPEILRRYPEVDGVSHPAIRKAVGLWARDAVARWNCANADQQHLLLGELPLIGNRLIELAQRRDDDLEAVLAGDQTQVLIPAPTREVRATIEAARVREMASPRHERERANAPPNVVDALWQEINRVAGRLGMYTGAAGAGYDPDLYVEVYRRLLRHRRTAVLPITIVLPVSASAYERGGPVRELLPTSAEAAEALAHAEALPEAELLRSVARWYD
jgi:hypothetical protein